jgi:hypothetical protein
VLLCDAEALLGPSRDLSLFYFFRKS